MKEQDDAIHLLVLPLQDIHAIMDVINWIPIGSNGDTVSFKKINTPMTVHSCFGDFYGPELYK